MSYFALAGIAADFDLHDLAEVLSTVEWLCAIYDDDADLLEDMHRHVRLANGDLPADYLADYPDAY